MAGTSAFLNTLKQPPQRRRGRHTSRRVGWRQHGLELVWPSMGLLPFARYMLLRIMRLAEQPHRVALGIAIGVLISYQPLLGTHLLVGAILCYLLGGSYLSMLLGSWIGNPWTYWLMWWSAYEVGRHLLSLPPADPYALLADLNWSYLWANFADIWRLYIWPTYVGIIPAAAPICGLTYFVVYTQLRRHNRKKAKRWRKKHGVTVNRRTGKLVAPRA